MFPTGFASFTYVDLSPRSHTRIRRTSVNCGQSNLEHAVATACSEHGFSLPEGNLSLHLTPYGSSLARGLALSPTGPSVLYVREYTAQPGFSEMISALDQTLNAIDAGRLDESSLYNAFAPYLVESMQFTESATLRPDERSEAELSGKVSFLPGSARAPPQEQQEYGLRFNDPFHDRLSRMYESKRLRARLAKTYSGSDAGPIDVDDFLRVLDVQPSRAEDTQTRVYKNLARCVRALVDTTFEDIDPVYRLVPRSAR